MGSLMKQNQDQACIKMYLALQGRELRSSYLPELHDKVHEGGRRAVRLLGRAHRGLQEVLNGDLVPQGLVEQPLAGRQLAVGQDLNLQRKNRRTSVGQRSRVKKNY